MRGGRGRLILILAVLGLLLPPAAEAAPRLSAVAASQGAFTGTSWALGLVVPEGSSLQGGASLKWEEVGNLTAVFSLPNITLPDGVVYAVVSVMTSDGTVLQAATGIGTNCSAWQAYSWAIRGLKTGSLAYSWILNATGPRMEPSADVAISIFRTTDGWELRILDRTTNASVERSFPQGLGSSLKQGDQEVFSLESYSRSAATFRSMGNLTLRALLLDGAEVSGGVYSYGEWDPNHNPLFVVGSSGSNPPYFISLRQVGDGSYAWAYTTSWKSSGGPPIGVTAFFAVLLVGVLVVARVVIRRTRDS